MFDDGLPFSELYDCHEVEKRGRGLKSRVLERAVSSEARQYDTPALLHQLVTSVVDEDKKNTCWAENGADLGCGAGCSGLAFRPSVKRMVGVDLSPEMIDKARERACYDELIVGDVECILENNDDETCPEQAVRRKQVKYDVIFACGLLVYIKDLRSVFSSVQKSLAPGGLFAFSAECIDGGDDLFVLQSCARFAHQRTYVDELASEFGFEAKALETSDIRRHNGRDVKGILAVFQLPA